METLIGQTELFFINEQQKLCSAVIQPKMLSSPLSVVFGRLATSVDTHEEIVNLEKCVLKLTFFLESVKQKGATVD